MSVCNRCHQDADRGQAIECVAATAVVVSRSQTPGFSGGTITRVKTSYSDIVGFRGWFCSTCLRSKVIHDVRTSSIVGAVGFVCVVLGIVSGPGWFLPAVILLGLGLFGWLSEASELRRINGETGLIGEGDMKRWFGDSLEESVHDLGRNKWWTKPEFDKWEASTDVITPGSSAKS